MSDLESQKRDARAAARARLEGLAAVRDEVSAAITRWFAGMNTREPVDTTLVYLATEREVSLDTLWKLPTSPRLAVPRVDWDKGTMSFRLLDDLDRVEIRRHGIREPLEEAERVDPSQGVRVLLPGLAFDRYGGRLGQGGGFYDRFVRGLGQGGDAADAPRIDLVGVCWSGQLVDRVPMGPQDVRVGTLLTEAGLVPCGPAGG